MIVLRGQAVVARERVRTDDEIAVRRRREREQNRRRKPSLIAPTVEHLANSADVDRVAFENLDQGLLEFRSAGPVEQREQTCGDTADILAALGEQAKERLAGRSGFAKTAYSGAT
jgi:hypothetical protein